MKEALLGYLGKHTVISFCLAYLAYILTNFSYNTEIDLTKFQNEWVFFVLTLVLVIIEVMIYSAMTEKYESVLRLAYKKPMLKYTFAKKQFERGKYEVEGKPRKSYDNLPQWIKIEIDKLDSSIYDDKIPKLCDLLIASFNSIVLLLYGYLSGKHYFWIIGIFSALYFGYFLISKYLDIKHTIINDYTSLFEE